jgi:gliding motility-associated-like protein
MRTFLLVISLLFFFLFLNDQALGQGSGNTLVFDGVNARVNIPDAPSFDHSGNDITIESWIFPTGYNAEGSVIFSKAETIFTREYYLCLLSDNRVRLAVFNNTSTDYLAHSVSIIPLNTWTHVAGTYSFVTGIAKIYINGILDVSINLGFVNIDATNMPPLIGAYWLSSPNVSRGYFPGMIDEVRLWYSVRTQTEIRDNMCRTLATPQANLVAYYRLDEANGLTANDASGNGNHGAVQNFPVAQTNDWNFSGAPIGNESVNEYPGSWTGLSLSLGSIPPGADEGTLVADNITGNPAGFHIYRVDSLPSQTAGLNKPMIAYFGTFLAGGAGPDYRIIYKYSGTSFDNVSCESFRLDQRADNSVPTWTVLNSTIDVSGNTLISTNNTSRKEIMLDTLCTVSCPPLTVDLGPDRNYCSNPFSDHLDAVTTGVNYLWSTGAISQTISVSQPGIYWIDISTPGCNYKRDSIVLTGYSAPELGPDTIICSGTDFSLDGGSGWASYRWSNGANSQSIAITQQGAYHVTVKNTYCILYSDTVLIDVINQEMTIPNLITPNGDKKNDEFSIANLVPNSSVAIYNTWGGLIYKSDKYQNGWKPEDYADGIYFYYLKSGCGTAYKGWIQVIR